MLLEIRRQCFHILLGTFFILLFYLLGTQQALALSILALIIGLLYSYKIFKGYPSKLNIFLSKLARDSEQLIPGKAAIVFLLGLIILLILDLFLLHSRRIVFAALCIVVFADGFATVAGCSFGKHKFLDKKTLEGSSAFFLTSLLFLSALFPANLSLVLITAIITTLVEALPLDDNLLLPSISALCIYLLLVFP